MAAKFRQRLDDAYIQVMSDFREDSHRTIWDNRVRQLRVTVGKHKITFTYFEQHRRHGKRSTTCVVLGHWPNISVAEARKAAKIIAGRTAANRITPGKRSAAKFFEAFEEYCKSIEAKAARKNKPPVWLDQVRRIGDGILLPEFRNWPLAELSNSPAHVRDFHARVTRDNGPIQANRALAIVRALYRHAARLNRSLPSALPTSAVNWNVEKPRETGIFDFTVWAAAWRAIESPSRRAFHLCGLLTGARPGELSRVSRDDIDLKQRTLKFANAKAGQDIVIPLTWPILRCLRHVDGFAMARREHKRDQLIQGHALRHAFASVAKAIRIDPLLLKLLLGHSLGSDVTERYISRGMLAGPLREAQRQISREILKRVGRNLLDSGV